MRLLESAMVVFARKGIDATVIEDVIANAEVSRGSFYNYFQTQDDLVRALHQELDNELLALVDAVVLTREDPAERLACGIRMVLRTAMQHRLLAHFFSVVSSQHAMTHSLAMHYMPRDIAAGIAAGRFAVASIELGLVLAMGATHAAICALTLRPDMPASYPEDMAYHVLLGLGMSRAQALKLVGVPIEDVAFPESALLFRTQGKQVHLGR